MTLNTHLLTLGTVCAILIGAIHTQAQTNPLPPGLIRSDTSASTVPPGMTPPPANGAGRATTRPSPTATGTRTAGANLLGLPASGPSASTAPADTPPKTNSTSLKFENADSYIVLMAYAAATGRTLILAPDVPKATITLKSQPDVELTKEEYLEAIEKTLAVNGIVLEPDGEKFLKVFAKGKVRTEGIKTIIEEPEKPHPELGRTISQMITFKHITIDEGQKALEGFKKPDGLFQVFERTNTILVTDTQENINRMLEIVKFIDQPIPITDEVNVRTIKYAKAEDIKKRIDELVAESQKQQQAKDEIKSNVSGAPGISRTSTSSSILSSRSLPPGLVRPGTTAKPAPIVPNETLSAMVSDADRGMIRGKVQVIADERSNKLIIVTRPENMLFFDKIIEVLDIPTAPDIQVKIIRLQHATADSSGTKDGEKGIADILNELIGNASASKSSTTSRTGTSSSSSRRSTPYGGPGGNQNLTSSTPTPSPTTTPRATAADREGTGKVGELSKENITILADQRINGLIVMASPTDMAILESIIKELDVELEQVIIETVLLQVQLTDSIKTGIDWIHNTIQSKNGISAMGAGGGGDNAPIYNPLGVGNNDIQSLIDAGKTVAGVAGAQYYFLFDKLDLNMVVEASKEDSRIKVLQSPVLMTVNNKEAVLESTDMRYLYKGVRYAGSYNYGTEVPDYEQRDFGVTIKVTPRISPNGNVTLTVDQKFETLGTPQFIPGAGGTSSTGELGGASSGGYFPTISTSKLQADVSVRSGQTVMLGGLVRHETSSSDSGIPILKDIPWIGRYLFGRTEDKDDSKETMVFLTPYVVKGSDEAQKEAQRRLNSINMDGVWSKGWSDSTLAEPPKTQALLSREKRKIEQIKKEAEAREELKDLYEEEGITPPPEKETAPKPDPEAKQPEAPTIKGAGLMQVIEEKTEPLLTIPPPARTTTP